MLLRLSADQALPFTHSPPSLGGGRPTRRHTAAASPVILPRAKLSITTRAWTLDALEGRRETPDEPSKEAERDNSLRQRDETGLKMLCSRDVCSILLWTAGWVGKVGTQAGNLERGRALARTGFVPMLLVRGGLSRDAPRPETQVPVCLVAPREPPPGRSRDDTPVVRVAQSRGRHGAWVPARGNKGGGLRALGESAIKGAGAPPRPACLPRRMELVTNLARSRRDR
ncbi:hypothetical protein PCL_10133 [Purpureocillium lilacinum]|uniref:Uncharacterized protein n=1 Tax=Purpureocillium lilacinum TaxID=33203 RepID=A0A2U3EF30_PURLI|nr:hypothetical protein PCL_10133 [Purpureocillium lilacinum]